MLKVDKNFKSNLVLLHSFHARLLMLLVNNKHNCGPEFLNT